MQLDVEVSPPVNALFWLVHFQLAGKRTIWGYNLVAQTDRRTPGVLLATDRQTESDA